MKRGASISFEPMPTRRRDPNRHRIDIQARRGARVSNIQHAATDTAPVMSQAEPRLLRLLRR